MNPLASNPALHCAERCYGVDIAADSTLVVAEYGNGTGAAPRRFPSGASGIAALRDWLAGAPARIRVCIRSCGVAALGVAAGLIALEHAEVALIHPKTLDRAGDARTAAAASTPEERALLLARIASRLP